MKTTQKLLTRAFSPGTLDLFAHVGERCRENPACWSIFGLGFLLWFLCIVAVVIHGINAILPH